MAVEGSYIADERDTRRAVRNAELISRFTGMTAVPVVASLENDHAVQQLVEDGGVRWFRFRERCPAARRCCQAVGPAHPMTDDPARLSLRIGLPPRR